MTNGETFCVNQDLPKDTYPKGKAIYFFRQHRKRAAYCSYHFRITTNALKDTVNISTNGDYAYYRSLQCKWLLKISKPPLWKIFNGNISTIGLKNCRHCNEIASKEKIFLFDVSKHMFGKPNYDRILKDCLIDSIRNSEKWSKM